MLQGKGLGLRGDYSEEVETQEDCLKVEEGPANLWGLSRDSVPTS